MVVLINNILDDKTTNALTDGFTFNPDEIEGNLIDDNGSIYTSDGNNISIVQGGDNLQLSPVGGNFQMEFPVNNIQSLKRKTVIPEDITVDEFIALWNSKIDEMYNKNIKNNIYSNVIQQINTDYIQIDWFHFNNKILPNNIQSITLVDENNILVTIKTYFIFRDMLCLVSSGVIYYITLSDIIKNDFILRLDNGMTFFKVLSLVAIEGDFDVLDMMFDETYFVLITNKNQVAIKYRDTTLELLPTITTLKYKTISAKKYDDVTMNIVSPTKDIYHVGNMERDEIEGERWFIRLLNLNILNTYDLSPSSNTIYNKKFNVEDIQLFHISEYNTQNKIFKFVHRENNNFLYYTVSFETQDDKIDCNVNVSKINFLFENNILTKNITDLSKSILIETETNTIMYFHHQNFIWKIILDNEDSTIEQLIFIEDGSSFNYIQRYYDYLICSVSSGYYVISENGWIFIKSMLPLIHNLISNINGNILEIKPIIPFSGKNTGWLYKSNNNLLYFYDEYNNIIIRETLDETKNLIGYYDRYNNLVKLKKFNIQ